ncbi:hypothetical protein N7492_008808 [Penicillium capsulatum]|uniref:Uncharacterized protein n=1 Tax=Penicillium capsulatum TaxID=69766 RepID=A0A9W9HTF3_9EURO|nr:hypothetical protein N7492_008808 [Penicillium capsulatum]KAJ6106209.1 hypothetical protein N7512_009726 [Penicillium capsulatum]
MARRVTRAQTKKEQGNDPPADVPEGASTETGTRKRKNPADEEPESTDASPAKVLSLRPKRPEGAKGNGPSKAPKLAVGTSPTNKSETRNLDEPTAEAVSRKPGQGLVEIHHPTQQDQKWLSLPVPPNKGLRKWPEIGFGDHAPTPRWRIVRSQASPTTGRNLANDLIKTRTGRTIIKGLRQNAQPRSYDATIGLGALTWKFDSGPETNQDQLSESELYEFAFRCLEAALNNHKAREQLRNAIVCMDIGGPIAHVEDPLPPIPTAPPKSDFGAQNGLLGVDEMNVSSNEITQFWANYKRPSLTIREGWNLNRARNRNILLERMFFHMAGTMGRSAEPSASYDSDSHSDSSSFTAPPGPSS